MENNLNKIKETKTMFLDSLLQIFRMDGVSDSRKLTSAKVEAERLAIVEQGLEIKRLQELHDRYVGVGLLKRKLEASPELDFDLGTPRNNVVIDNRGGQIIFITQCTGTAKFRFDGIVKPTYTVRVGVMPVPFEKLYLTNTAQAGKKLTMIIGQDPSVSFVTDPVTGELKSMVVETQNAVAELQASVALLGNIPRRSTTPLLVDVIMTNADEEYEYTFPDDTKKLSLEIGAGGADFRVAWETGKVATPTQPYIAVPMDEKFARDNVNLVGKTIYFASNVSAQMMIIESYT